MSGYPIETDVQLTKDNALLCFHDDSLKRMTGVDSLIWDKTFEEARALKLAETEEVIPTFDELLSFVDGRVPLVIEYKTQPDKEIIVDKTLPYLDKYKGEFVVQSFDPLIVKTLRKRRPEFIRGQLICQDRHKEQKWIIDRMLAHGLFNCFSKPDFINMNLKWLPVSKAMKRGKRLICWTVRSDEDRQKAEKYADNYIFEYIRP